MDTNPLPLASGPPGQSEYMHWAKTRQTARFTLAVSGVPPVRREDLPDEGEGLEWNGGGGYGWPPLQEALGRYLGVEPDRVVRAAGTSMANHLAMAVCLERGDEVLIEEPGYGLLVDVARYLGAVVRRFPRRREDGFQPDLEVLRARLSARTRLIVLTDLHNPSSARLPEATLRAVVEMAADRGVRVLVDEVYLDAAFDPSARTAHRLGDHVITTSSLTKVYGLPGLRCGWVVAAPALAERMRRLDDLFGVIPAHAAEQLSLEALRRIDVLARRAQGVLEVNRVVWNRFLGERADLEDSPSRMGTVVFPRLRSGRVDELAERLRRAYETTVVPGRFFGEPDAFRVGLGVPPAEFAEGLSRLGAALDGLGRGRDGNGFGKNAVAGT